MSWHSVPPPVAISGFWQDNGVASSHHISRVHNPSRQMRAIALFRDARRTCYVLQGTFKKGFHAPASQTLQRRIIKLCEKDIGTS